MKDLDTPASTSCLKLLYRCLEVDVEPKPPHDREMPPTTTPTDDPLHMMTNPGTDL
jgi:hypothetical protein